MTTQEDIVNSLKKLLDGREELVLLAEDDEKIIEFGIVYQRWYSRAYKIVESLAPERLQEFCSYYLIDTKRKHLDASNYAIQDYIKGIMEHIDVYNEPLWDRNNVVQMRIMNQVQILASLSSRIGTVLQDVKGHLLAEIQDSELKAAIQLKDRSKRAAGALAGVVLERHLQRVAENHKVTIRKKCPTISDLNDPLKTENIIDIPTWRKIQLLADIRNLCTHQKKKEPTDDQVEELISGVNEIIKKTF